MACLKMILAHNTGVVYPTLNLARVAQRYGAYVVNGESVNGLIYAPFVELLSHEFGLNATSYGSICISEVIRLVQDGFFFMASVHPSIRRPEQVPPHKGGHLVLITDADESSICFHNPSGDSFESQSSVILSVAAFEVFFANRGVSILRAERSPRGA